MDEVNLSVIIATRNRESILYTTLETAIAAIRDKMIEIIVVNDGEQDLIVPEQFKAMIRVYNNPRRGVSSARNFGAANAKGNVLFFIDDDMWIIPEAIDWIDEQFKIEQNRGAVYNLNWEYPSTLHKKLNSSKIGRFLLDAEYNTMWGRMHEKGIKPQRGLYQFHSIASCSLVMHHTIFKQVGGYNEQLIFQGEDIDLSNRLRLMSIPVFVVFDVTLYHNHQDRLDLKEHLERLSRGYKSEFEAAYQGIINPSDNRNYNGIERVVFELFLLGEEGIIFIYKLIPNHRYFKLFSNRLIGILSGLGRFKEWKKVSIKPNKLIV
jgi:glycosyltransferase involved in cell wall biosynthesis